MEMSACLFLLPGGEGWDEGELKKLTSPVAVSRRARADIPTFSQCEIVPAPQALHSLELIRKQTFEERTYEFSICDLPLGIGESSEFVRQGFLWKLFTGGSGLVFQGFVQWAAILLQRLEVEVGLVSSFVSPAGEVDPRQLKGQRPAGGVVFVVVLFLCAS